MVILIIITKGFTKTKMLFYLIDNINTNCKGKRKFVIVANIFLIFFILHENIINQERVF